MGDNEELERLIRTLTENEPAELRTYLTLPDPGRPLIVGSTAPVIGHTTFEPLGTTELLVPIGNAPNPSDYAAAFLTSDEYLQLTVEGVAVPTELLILHFASAYPREITLVSLAMLNGLLFSESKQQEILEEFRSLLSDELRARFDAAMRAPHRGAMQAVIARQPLLSAMREIFTMNEVDKPSESMPNMAAAILLSHSVASALSGDPPLEDEVFMGVSAHTALEIVQVSFLNQAGDIYASISRTARLWREYGPRLQKYQLREEPATILAEATGLDFEDLLALGFALLAHSMQWEPGKPPYLRPDIGSSMASELLDSFKALISDSFEGFRSSFEGTTSRFDFTPIQQKPALLAEPGYLVLDPTFLWQRITSGLYWYVHDHEKKRDGESRQLWTQAYSEMVELMVEDQLERMSPVLLGDAERPKAFFTEEDLRQAYSGKVCDAAIHFGSEIVLFEVVSGQMTTLTRIEGSKDQLIQDTEKLVIKKCRQLDATARNILADESALTGRPGLAGLRVLPIVVVTEGYPLNVLTAALIRKMLGDEGLLSDSRLESVGIVDLEDLDLLEAIHEAGHSLLDVLLSWRNGPLADTSFRTFLSSVPEYRGIDRPAGLVKQTREVFRDLLDRLGLPGGQPESK